ncbi:MAG: lactate utilization protein [Mogibacterium sp.]|nr:lactate utilization protein [Mogibacterium sp.]
MNEIVAKRNSVIAQNIIKGLEKRNMKGFYAADKDEAIKIATELIGEGSSVTMGGAQSVKDLGLFDILKSGNYNFIDREEIEDKRAAYLAAYDADAYLGSCNAITQDGILVNIDGVGNRLSAYCFGPKKVVLIVGMNKVCPDLDSAVKRARNVAATVNVQRFGRNTPCAKTGQCHNCTSPECICGQFLITRFTMTPNRIHVIIVNDYLGF